MVHLGNMLVIDRDEPWLMKLDPTDLEQLLDLRGWEQLGHIVELNRTARYGNRLNAFALIHQLAEVTREMGQGPVEVV